MTSLSCIAEVSTPLTDKPMLTLTDTAKHHQASDNKSYQVPHSSTAHRSHKSLDTYLTCPLHQPAPNPSRPTNLSPALFSTQTNPSTSASPPPPANRPQHHSPSPLAPAKLGKHPPAVSFASPPPKARKSETLTSGPPRTRANASGRPEPDSCTPAMSRLSTVCGAFCLTSDHS